MGSVTFDVEAVRAAYPALRDGYAYLDGPAGTQVPEDDRGDALRADL